MKVHRNVLFRFSIFLISLVLVINPLNVGSFPGEKANAQSSLQPFVVFVNGYENGRAWGRYSDGSVNPLMGNVVESLPPDSEIWYVPWDRFENGANQRSRTSNDAEFLRQGADFINNQLDPRRPLILIGHSFGGDSLLSLAPRINRRIQFLGVIDPTAAGGLREPITRREVPSNVAYFFNRWQENAVNAENVVPFDSRVISGYISNCRAGTCDQEEQSLARNSDGSEITVNCESWEVSCPGYQPWPGGSNGTKAERLAHNNMPSDEYLQSQVAERISQVIASYTPPVANTVISSTDSTRGWSWNGTIASYITVENGQNVLYVQPFNGQAFGDVTSRQMVSSSNAFRGWSWDGTTASYVTFKSGEQSILYVRPFDGQTFGSVTERQIFSDTDSIRGWSWDGTTASYVTVQNGRNVLYVRPFDGQTFGSVIPGQTISRTDSIRGWSWDGTTASYVTVNENGGNTVYMRPFDGEAFGF
jgi:hypothetical protein